MVVPLHAPERISASSIPLPSVPVELEADPSLARLIRLAGSVLRAPTVVAWLAEDDRLVCDPPNAASRDLCRQVFEAGRPLILRAPGRSEGAADPAPAGVACLGVPLVGGEGKCFGAICVLDDASRAWHRSEGEILADLVAFSLTERELREELKRRDAVEESLAHDLQLYKHQVDTCTDMIARYNREGLFLAVSPACRQLLGYEPEELLGRPIYELIHPDDMPAIAESAAALQASSEIQLHACRLRHKDGHYLWVEGSNRALHDPTTGEILEVHCASRDVTERIRAEEALRLSEERFHLATLATSEAIWDWNLRTDVIWWNESVTRLFGYTLEEVGTNPARWYELIHPDDLERVATSVHEAMDGGAESWMVQYRFRCKDGTYAPVVDRGVIKRDEAGHPLRMVGSMMDLTRIEQAEAALRESRERLVAALTASGTGTFRWDIQTGLVECDEQLDRLYGSPPGHSVRSIGEWAALIHPDDRDAVIQLCRRCLAEHIDFAMEYRVVWGDGSVHWLDDRSKIFYDDIGLPLYMTGACVDVTDRKRAEERLAHQATHDDLTGLPNRTLLFDRMEQCIAAGSGAATPFALLLLDLDRFKEINDTFGHHSGDAVLHQLSPILEEAVRHSDVVARLGGDEFGIILPGADERWARAVADRIRAKLEQPILVNGMPLELGVSIGIALHPQHGLDAATLLKHADVAMYAAKRGKLGSVVYAIGHDDHSPRRLRLLGELRQAIEQGQLQLHYQPTYDLKTLRPVGVEALARWRHPRDGFLGPDEFIPMAEQTGLIRPLGLWALREALRQRRLWFEDGLDLVVAVNLSPENLQDDQLLATIDDLLAEAGGMSHRLTIEVTESAMMADPARAKEVLTRLHHSGVMISIDDFGTGYSSLAYLRELPAHEVKVDRSFVRDMANNDRDACIVRSVIELGHNLGLRVLAEGVESQASLDLLRDWGCDLAQGYFLGMPMPAAELAQKLNSPDRPHPLPAPRFGRPSTVRDVVPLRWFGANGA